MSDILINPSRFKRSLKLRREANDLQRTTAKPAEKQPAILLFDERGKSTGTARLSLDLFRGGKTYRFRLTNVGEVAARDAEIEQVLRRAGYNPTITSEYAEEFPDKRLMLKPSVTLIATLHLGSPSVYNVILS